jgi:hypothetical protein
MLHLDRSRIFLALLLTATLLAVTGCFATRYRAYDEDPEGLAYFDRQVEFEVTADFHRDPSDCIVVLPLRGTGDQQTRDMIERAFARYLMERVPRVIGPRERRRLARTLSFDIANPEDWAGFARASGCANGLDAGLLEARGDYLVVWAQRTLGLEAALVSLAERRLLWRARHVGRRADGGVPLSPISAAVEGAVATGFAMDDDIRPSLVDEVVRRIIVTLPDVR